jgi:cytochrome d ubiquinol oxidase subunit I
MTTGFMVASVYAVGWLRGHRDRYHRLGFTLPFTLGAVLALVQFVMGDIATGPVVLSTAREAALKPWWR